MLKDKLVPLTQNQSQAHMQKLMAHLLETGEGESFAIWGAGATGQRAMEYLRQNWGEAIKPKYIVDNNSALWNTGGQYPRTPFLDLRISRRTF